MKLFVLFVLFVFTGCTPVATYPPIENDPALIFSDSANEPIPTVFATTLRYAHEHFGGIDTVVFRLPDGVGVETYRIVSEKLGGAVPLSTQNETAYYITELRKRPFRAEADMFFPSSTGIYNQATLYLSSSLTEPWKVQRERVWLVPVDKLPAPVFVNEKQNP